MYKLSVDSGCEQFDEYEVWPINRNTDQQECNEAAALLGLSHTDSERLNSYNYPKGCFWNKIESKLKFNHGYYANSGHIDGRDSDRYFFNFAPCSTSTDF